VLADGREIGLEDLPEPIRRPAAAAPPVGAIREQIADLEQRRIEEALAAEGGNQTRAAKRLGISRRALIYKLEKYGLKR
ncbi:MAG TPA: helix-turn-helix domain-containing protein, partial [Polyangia bacterium]